LSHLESAKAHETLEKAIEETGIDVESVEPAVEESTAAVQIQGKGKGKGKAVDVEVEETEAEAAASGPTRSSSEERLAKLKELRMRMVCGILFILVFLHTHEDDS
jgi:hypothetical protein